MPTKGRPQVRIRWDDLELAAIETALERRNRFTRERPLTFAEFVRVAVREKLQKMARCRGQQHGMPSPLQPTDNYIEALEHGGDA